MRLILRSIVAVLFIAAAASAAEQTLVLKDGRKIQVSRMARRAGQVLFETTRGERFSVPESEVLSPPLDTIPLAEPGAAPPPPTAPTTPTVVATPVPPPAEAPAPPVVTASAAPPAKPIFDPGDFAPLPDRWSIAYPEDPRFAEGHPLDPYNQNTIKGDRPIVGDSVFLVFTAIVDVPTELRRVPVGSGVSTANPSSLEFFGNGNMLFTSPRATGSIELFHGQTGFKPKTWALKASGAFNVNYLRAKENNIVNIDPTEGKTRRREDFGIEEAFGELKLLTLSSHYDFVSVRAGIQPFVSDFRGFIFSDFNLGARTETKS